MADHPRRYVLCPGYVTSKADGQRHYIGGPQLRQLYGVRAADCVERDQPGFQSQPGDVNLFPDHHGNYGLPEDPKPCFAEMSRQIGIPAHILGRRWWAGDRGAYLVRPVKKIKRPCVDDHRRGFFF